MRWHQAEKESSQKLIYSNWMKKLYFYKTISKTGEFDHRAVTSFVTPIWEKLVFRVKLGRAKQKRKQREAFSLCNPEPKYGMKDVELSLWICELPWHSSQKTKVSWWTQPLRYFLMELIDFRIKGNNYKHPCTFKIKWIGDVGETKFNLALDFSLN